MHPLLRYRASALLVVVFVLMLGGCDGSDPDPDNAQELPVPRFVADSSFTETESGLRYFDFDRGDTTRVQADSGDVVLVHYHGWLLDGTLFDSSIVTGQPIQFVLGQGRVIEGWDEGLIGMYLGGDRQLIIPPALGYGDTERGNIPANSTLVFEVFLIGTQ